MITIIEYIPSQDHTNINDTINNIHNNTIDTDAEILESVIHNQIKIKDYVFVKTE